MADPVAHLGNELPIALGAASSPQPSPRPYMPPSLLANPKKHKKKLAIEEFSFGLWMLLLSGNFVFEFLTSPLINVLPTRHAIPFHS